MKRFVEGEDERRSRCCPSAWTTTSLKTTRFGWSRSSSTSSIWGLGFEGVEPAATGRPSYHPAVLLKIYIYGYLNRIQSSRRLEREAQRNVELMWLTGRLAPDFKTIADFRRDNGKAIRNVCRHFVALCRKLDLFSQSIVAIDGSKFKAVNNRDRNFTSGKVRARMEQIEQSIDRYLAAMDTADRTQSEGAEAKTTRLKDKIAKLSSRCKGSKRWSKAARAPDEQISLTDPDARSMATSGRGTGIVGYNVQTAVDDKHHLIVAHEVINVGHDRAALADDGRASAGRYRHRRTQRRCRSRLLQRRRDPGVRASRHHDLRAQAADLQQQGRGALRQTGLRLHRRTTNTAVRLGNG